MGGIFSTKSSDSSGSSGTSGSSSDSKMTVDIGWNIYTLSVVSIGVVLAIVAVYLSWQWNCHTPTAMRSLYAFGAAIFAPFYVLFALISRRNGIHIADPLAVVVQQKKEQKEQAKEQQKKEQMKEQKKEQQKTQAKLE
jgi:hypothetical protein